MKGTELLELLGERKEGKPAEHMLVLGVWREDKGAGEKVGKGSLSFEQRLLGTLGQDAVRPPCGSLRSPPPHLCPCSLEHLRRSSPITCLWAAASSPAPVEPAPGPEQCSASAHVPFPSLPWISARPPGTELCLTASSSTSCILFYVFIFFVSHLFACS